MILPPGCDFDCADGCKFGHVRSRFLVGLERGDRGNDFVSGHNGTGVVRHIDFERGVHHLVRVVRRRVFHHCGFVAKLGGKANGGFYCSGRRNLPYRLNAAFDIISSR
jgi:hypothetical protein